MSIEEEIKYREEIKMKVRNGKKITPEERIWLVTHCVYNLKMGPPYLNTDMIQMQKCKKYCVQINVESMTYPRWIIPVITVPGGKGKIEIQNKLFDLNGKPISKKTVKVLGALIGLESKNIEFTYESDWGLMGVDFECEYYDAKQMLTIRKSSSVGTPDYAMIRDEVAENKIIYHCKPPTENDFDSYVFSVKWEAVECEGNGVW